MIDMTKLDDPWRKRRQEAYGPAYPEQPPAEPAAPWLQQARYEQPSTMVPTGGGYDPTRLDPSIGKAGGGQIVELDTRVPGMPPPGFGQTPAGIPPPGETLLPGGQAPQAGGGEFPYPQEWGTAGDMYTQMIQQKGMPLDVSGYGEKLWPVIQQQSQDLARQLAEQAGMGVGGRYGSPFFGQLAEAGTRAGERFGLEMAGRELGAQEAGMGRMFGAGAPLAGIGQARAQLPMQVSQHMMGLGGAQQQMQQQEMDRQRQEFMRTQPEYSPLMQQMYGQGQLPMGPEMYQPSFLDQILGLGGNIAGMFM